jgi:hypothetical protein
MGRAPVRKLDEKPGYLRADAVALHQPLRALVIVSKWKLRPVAKTIALRPARAPSRGVAFPGHLTPLRFR